MRYKKGDRVRIKSLEWYNANKNSESAIIFPDFRIFDESMSKFCGKIVTIDAYVPRGNYYDIKEDGNVNYWSDEMFEGLAIEEPQENMVSLEKVKEWLYKNFYESYNLNDYGKYDLDEPYITSSFDTIDEMIEDFRKTMEE